MLKVSLQDVQQNKNLLYTTFFRLLEIIILIKRIELKTKIPNYQ